MTRLDHTPATSRLHRHGLRRVSQLVMAASVASVIPVSTYVTIGGVVAHAAATQPGPQLPPPMHLPPSASSHEGLTSSNLDPRFTVPAEPAPLCGVPATGAHRPLYESRQVQAGARICAAPATPRSPKADLAYDAHHQGAGAPATQATYDMDSSATPAILTSGPTPPTYPSPDWVQQSPSSSPAGRYAAAMAYDQVNGVVVLFGGVDSSTTYGDTWTWNGTTWTQQHPATSPAPRDNAQMTYDSVRHRIVLFGGDSLISNTYTQYGDTWTWDGTTWAQLSPAAVPHARSDGAFAFDPSLGKAVLFGGGYNDGTSYSLGDTWTWDGTTWAQLSPASSPPALGGARLAYNPSDSTMVMFGGLPVQATSAYGDTWTFNGSTWTDHAPTSTSPPARYEYALVLNGGLNAPIMFGGYAFDSSGNAIGDVNDTWMWNGSEWLLAAGIASPGGRDTLAGAYDTQSGQQIIFGGWNGFSSLGDTWVYAGGATEFIPTLTVTAERGVLGQYSRGELIAYTLSVGNPGAPLITGASVSDTPGAGSEVAPILPVITDVGSGASIACSGSVGCIVTPQRITVSGLSIPAQDRLTITYWGIAEGTDRGCSTVADSATAHDATGTSPATSTSIDACGTGLGVQPWWTDVARSTGPQSQALINIANGNLILQQTDTTPIAAHGRLGFVLDRAYNSEEVSQALPPGALAPGWTFTVDATDGLASSGVTASGLVVPTASAPVTGSPSFALNSAVAEPVVLIDRSGTRHLFRLAGLPAPIDVTSFGPTGSPVGPLAPRVLSVDTTTYNHLCVDQTYTGPAGVHLSLWRYIEVHSSNSSSPCVPASGTSAVVLGYGAERPDRIRYEFSWDGHKLDTQDANGNELTFHYDGSLASGQGVGHLVTVTEPATGRSIQLTYPAGEVDVKDPALRLTRYVGAPGALTSVINPDGTHTDLGYGTSCGSAAGQLCSVSDLRGNASTLTYTTTSAEGANLLGQPRAASFQDRMSARTAVTYHSAPDYVTADLGTERQRFQTIDATGRVAQVDEGDTSNANWLHTTQYRWDVSDTTHQPCRQPDAVADNNLCRVIRLTKNSLATAEDTSFVYNPTGALLATHACLAASDPNRQPPLACSGGTRDQTSGYHTQYVNSDASVSTFDDVPAGSGMVTSAAGPGPNGARATATTLFALSDQTASLTPRGNAAGSGYAAYETIYIDDDNASVPPNVHGSDCLNPQHPSTNGGSRCQANGPSFDGTDPTTTWFDYDANGQLSIRWTPDANAIGTFSSSAYYYSYVYYTDSDRDLSGTTPAGGWLKAVVEPSAQGYFQAYGYDAAGNVERTWDKDATATATAQGKTINDFPGTLAAPPNPNYNEVLHGSSATAISSPWRYVISTRDQLQHRTVYTVDPDGNQSTIRPPRGADAQPAVASYDTTQTFDKDDRLATRTAADGGQWSYTYDVAGNRVLATDPKGATASVFDPVNRLIETARTRGPGSGATPSGCVQPPAPAGPLSGQWFCTRTSYDGVDNVIATADGNAQVTTYGFDGLHQQVDKHVPRDGTTTVLETGTVHDLDGNVTDICPPRQYSEGAATTCAPPASPYGEHRDYNVAGHLVARTTYGVVGGTGGAVSKRTTMTYDADGNVLTTIDPVGQSVSNDVTTFTYDLLDRKLSATAPRDSSTTETTTWSYDPYGSVTAVLAPGTRRTLSTYDAAHRLVDTITGADNSDPAQVGVTDSTGGADIRIRNVYDDDGNIVEVLPPSSFTTGHSASAPDLSYMQRTDYDVVGRPVATWSPRYDTGAHRDPGLGSTQTTQCPQNAAPQAVPGADPYPSSIGVCVTRTSYDHAGNRTGVILPTSNGNDGRHIDYSYTQDNLLLQVTAPPADGTSNLAVTAFTYNGDGKQLTATDPAGRQTVTSYYSDELTRSVANPIDTSSGMTHTWSYGYDANGNRTTVTDGLNQTTTSTYSTDNLLTDVVDAAGDHTSYGYDANGNQTQIWSPSANSRDASNTSGTPTTSTYTFDNLLATSTVPVSPDGTKTRSTTYLYDAAGRKTEEDLAFTGAGSSSQLFRYYPDDRLQHEQGRDSNDTIDRTYDADGNLTSAKDTTATSSTTVTATYYLDDSPLIVNDGTATSTSAYDGAGSRVARSTRITADGSAFADSYAYNDAELPVRLGSTEADPSLQTAYTWTYYPDGRLHTEGDPNKDTRTWNYNTDGTLSTVSLLTGSTSLSQWSYTWDSNYRQTTQGYVGQNASGLTTSQYSQYGYDAASRITSDNDGNSAGALAATWDHDGNRLSYGRKGNDVTFTYNADDSIASSQRFTTPSGSSTTVPGPTHAYQYDQLGDLNIDGCADYGYDGFDRLVKVAALSAPATPASDCGMTMPAQYAYDALDRQISHTDGNMPTTTLTYDGLTSNIAVESMGMAPMVMHTAYGLDTSGGHMAVSTHQGGSVMTTELLSDDGMGTITTAVGTDGSVHCSALFDPFGQAVGAMGSMNECNSGMTVSDMFYKDSRHDVGTNGYRFGSRTYQPSQGAYAEPDVLRNGSPAAQLTLEADPMTRNAHAFVDGDPLNMWDPTGHMGIPECNGNNHGRCDDGTQQSTPQQDETIHWQIQNDYRQYQHQQKQIQRLTNVNRDSDNNSGCRLYDPYSPRHHWDGCDRNPGGVCHSPGGIGSRDCHYQDALPGDEAPRGMTFQSELPAGKDCNCELSVLFQLAMLPVGGGEEAVADAGVAAGEAFVDTLAGHAAQAAEEQAVGGAAAEAGDSAVGDLAESCAVNSFTGDTPVLLADGSEKAISDVKVGDTVEAGNAQKGTTAAEPVQRVIVGHGVKHLVSVGVAGETIEATYNHPFWVVEDQKFEWANQLKPGEHLWLADGRVAVVQSIRLYDETTTVYNLSIANVHTFFVGSVPVLVHNSCGAGFAPGEGESALTPNRLQHGSRHLVEQGLLPPWSGTASPGLIQSTLAPILENPYATFDTSLGGTAVKGFLGEVGDAPVAAFVFKEGPYATQLATSFVPSFDQLAAWGLVP